ncbi:MAG: hypothetical protein A2293_00515 [Elusimicrobia bacterium RIFOXYB2_FULL_49_7]|nr:MAG: hypothetical protein A2293_00515 [Elusimicrobia bacterium RIFOXYB2_FULL_49_7]
MKSLITAFCLGFIALSFSADTEFGQVEGRCVFAFLGTQDRALFCFQQADGVKSLILTGKNGREATWTLPVNAEFLSNTGFADYAAFALVSTVDSATGFQRIDLKFIHLGSGAQVVSRVGVKPTMEGRWLNGQNDYFINGRLNILSGDKVKSERKSGSPYSAINSSRTWGITAMVKETAKGKSVDIELEEFATNDMIRVASFPCAALPPCLMAFPADPRFVYYCAGANPALYDLKERQSLLIDNLDYRHPEYFGFFLDGEQTFYFYDFHSIVAVDRKKFEIRDVKPLPFGTDRLEILAAGKMDVAGALIRSVNGLKVYRAFFTYNLKKGKEAIFPLPHAALLVDIRDGKGCYYYIDEQNMLKFNTREIE